MTWSNLGVSVQVYDYNLYEAEVLADREDVNRAFAMCSGSYGSSGPNYVDIKRTTNRGASWWTVSSSVDSDEKSAYYLLLAQNPNNVNTMTAVIGNIERIRIMESTNRGSSWSAPEVITSAAEGFIIRALGLQYLSDDTLVLFYGVQGGDYPSVFSRRSTNNGASWQDRVQVNTTVSGNVLFAGDLINAEGTLHAAWSTEENYKHNSSTDGGLTWQSNTVLQYLYCSELALAAPAGGVPVLLAARTYDPEQGYNLHSNEFDGSVWGGRRHINTFLGGVKGIGGLAATTNGVMVANWKDEFDGDDTRDLGYASYSDPNRTDDFGIQIDETTLVGDRSVQRGDLFSFSYQAGNYTDEPGTVEVWVDVYGQDQFIYRELKRNRVTLAAGEERGFTVSLTVPPRAPFQEYIVYVWVDDDNVDIMDYHGFQTEVIR